MDKIDESRHRREKFLLNQWRTRLQEIRGDVDYALLVADSEEWKQLLEMRVGIENVLARLEALVSWENKKAA